MDKRSTQRRSCSPRAPTRRRRRSSSRPQGRRSPTEGSSRFPVRKHRFRRQESTSRSRSRSPGRSERRSRFRRRQRSRSRSRSSQDAGDYGNTVAVAQVIQGQKLCGVKVQAAEGCKPRRIAPNAYALSLIIQGTAQSRERMDKSEKARAQKKLEALKQLITLATPIIFLFRPFGFQLKGTRRLVGIPQFPSKYRSRMSASIPTKTLPSGHKIPVIGLGVYQSEPGPETYNAVLSALRLGYRHIDTAQYYENEADVGRAVKDSGIPRDEMFITSKLFISNWGHEKAISTTKASNEKLGLGYIDLYLLHAPGDADTRDETWKALEELQEQGILKDIGVSNFGEAHLEKLLKNAKVKPAVNQVELHPWMTRTSLVKYCKEHDILLEAYSPLAKASKLSDPTLNEVAKEVNATAAQVLVAFSLANDFITLPKSVNEERQKTNLEAAKIKLTPEQTAKLAALDEYLVTGWDPIKEHAV